MNAHRFDVLARTRDTTSSHRRLVNLLGSGALLGAAALALRGGEASAQSIKERGGAGNADTEQPAVPASAHRHKRPKTCRPGKRLAFVVVPPSGAAVHTPVLRKGQAYRLRATGFWLTNAQFGNDAFAAFPFADPFAPVLTFQGVRLGLSIDDGSPDKWGGYNATHNDEIDVTDRDRPAGRGRHAPLGGHARSRRARRSDDRRPDEMKPASGWEHDVGRRKMDRPRSRTAARAHGGIDMDAHRLEDTGHGLGQGAGRRGLLGGLAVGALAALLGPFPGDPAAAKKKRRKPRPSRCAGKNWCVDRTQTCGPAGGIGKCFVEAFGGNVCGEVLFQASTCADCAPGNCTSCRCVLAAGGGDRCNNGANGSDFICIRPL